MATSSAEQAPILVVAALGRELAKLNSEALPGVTLLETGEGVANAERSLDAWLEQKTARAVLSIGFAGALSQWLNAGDLVIAREIHDAAPKPDAELLSAAERIRMGGPTPHFGVAVTSREILWQAESKRTLARNIEPHEIGFVDMESTAIASVCGRRGLPFLIIRSITDLLHEDLPLDFNLYRDADGRVDSKRILKAAMLKPRALARLLELRKRSELCAERMAEFVRCLVPLIG